VSLGRQIRRYAVEMAAVIAIFIAAIAVGGYILSHQRLKFPWEHTYSIQADFTSAQAITPGQGQTVTVAGVDVGEIASVNLHDGLARVKMDIDRDKLKAVHKDATMLLRPKTGLQDMSVELHPGSASAPKLGSDDVLPASQTEPNVNADEVLSALDQDTRAWLRTVLNAGAIGLKDRGEALREVFKAGAPTLEHTKRVTDAILARRQQLRRVVHNLRLINDTAASRDADLEKLVEAANSTFAALGQHDQALSDSFRLLPGTLETARAALADARPFARELKPAADALAPTEAKLTKALPALDPLLRDATPATRKIRGLVRQSKPVVKDLRPALGDLLATTPSLSKTFDVLTRVVNEMAYNPDGQEEGYLFWFAWFAHNANSIMSTEDANGVAWRGLLAFSCSTALSIPQINPLIAALVKLPVCPADASGDSGR
jgi:phospholipid/cholesterol/gamma-HCH transport system substrate-binding protein